MANSISFNGIDLSAYGLRIRKRSEDFNQPIESEPLTDKSYVFSPLRPGKEISFDVVVAAADLATLNSYMDSIRNVLNLRTAAALKIDAITDRYWMAHFTSFPKGLNTAKTWEGTLMFFCGEPAAYDNTETTGDSHTIDSDPDTFNEVVGGTAEAWPVWTLTADDAATVVTITNSTSGEELEITITLAATDVLEVDTQTMIVKLNGTENMGGVLGRFPGLLPGTNAFSIAGFSGTAQAVYRKRYV